MTDTPTSTVVNSREPSRPGTPTALSTPPATVAVTDKPQDDSSRLKLFLGLLRKFIGVPDMAAVRFSLPAQLIEPIPNLEYWHYLDRPETFISIGQSDSELGRMLEVLRFWFTKDLKYVKGKPCKPYNSVLGEFFRCNWELNADAGAFTDPAKAPPQAPADPLDKSKQNLEQPVTLSYMTEQTSHHPPVSAYYMECPERGIVGYGYDQLSAKFTGTAVRVIAGNFNQGIYIKLEKTGEEYQLTHPAANLSGLLKGSLYISVSDTCYITCPQSKIKTILTYAEEGWLGRAQNKVFGVVFRYDPENDKYTRIKDVPDKDVLAKIDGCWQEQIFYWLAGDKKAEKDPSARNLLMDVSPLMPVPKLCPPEEEQLVNESRKFWKDLTAAIQEKRFADANRIKQTIEQNQRDKAAERKAAGKPWAPRFFQETTDPEGRPHLNEEGKQLMQGLQSKDFKLKEPEVTAA